MFVEETTGYTILTISVFVFADGMRRKISDEDSQKRRFRLVLVAPAAQAKEKETNKKSSHMHTMSMYKATPWQ